MDWDPQQLTHSQFYTLLRLLVKNPHNCTVRSMLAASLQRTELLHAVIQMLGQSCTAAAPLAMLADVAKQDAAGMHAADILLRQACAADPCQPSHVLSLMHLLELQMKIDVALHVGRAFCVQPRLLFGYVDTATLAGVLEPFAQSGAARDDGLSDQHGPTCRSFSDAPPIHPAAEFQADEELRALAVVLTCTKLLFLHGSLAACRAACDPIAAALQAAQLDLSSTCIRNEAAYFHLVSKLLHHPFRLIASPRLSRLRPLYVCGDSHCLSGAWREVHWNGSQHLLVPRLVTGVKIWHLRPESTFYTKVGWLFACTSIPPGSQVIMCLGELDCRSGLLEAVHKQKYPNLDAAICSLVQVYCQVLNKVQSDYHHAQLWVSPVPPSLQETREVVSKFNQVLQAEVTSLSADGILWLDYAERCFPDNCQGQTLLHFALKFDEAHLDPMFIDLLEQACVNAQGPRLD